MCFCRLPPHPQPHLRIILCKRLLAQPGAPPEPRGGSQAAAGDFSSFQGQPDIAVQLVAGIEADELAEGFVAAADGEEVDELAKGERIVKPLTARSRQTILVVEARPKGCCFWWLRRHCLLFHSPTCLVSYGSVAVSLPTELKLSEPSAVVGDDLRSARRVHSPESADESPSLRNRSPGPRLGPGRPCRTRRKTALERSMPTGNVPFLSSESTPPGVALVVAALIQEKQIAHSETSRAPTRSRTCESSSANGFVRSQELHPSRGAAPRRQPGTSPAFKVSRTSQSSSSPA
jgi:hypothetical protein